MIERVVFARANFVENPPPTFTSWLPHYADLHTATCLPFYAGKDPFYCYHTPFMPMGLPCVDALPGDGQPHQHPSSRATQLLRTFLFSIIFNGLNLGLIPRAWLKCFECRLSVHVHWSICPATIPWPLLFVWHWTRYACTLGAQLHNIPCLEVISCQMSHKYLP